MSDFDGLRRRHDWRVPCCWGCMMHGHADGCHCARTLEELYERHFRERANKIRSMRQQIRKVE